MAVPKVNRRPKNGISPRTMGIAVVSLLFIVATVLRRMHYHTNAAANANSDEAKIEPLEHENLFLSTIKCCIPAESEKCKTYIPDSTGPDESKVHRVAFLSTAIAVPHEEILHLQGKAQQDKSDINVFFRSSVPPYGYGKTHGLTKIVRWQHQPLLLEASAALQSALEAGETYRTITLADVKATLRQVLRFHCRLSHVAAHTAILSIRQFSNPSDVVPELTSFLNYPNNDSPEPQLEALVQRVVDETTKSYDANEKFASQLLSNLQQADSPTNIRKVLDDVLLREVNTTKGLTTWPCPSFWTVGGDDDNDPLQISPIVKRIAKALSPDCMTDPLSNCWVNRDKCEARGDGICRDA